MPQVLIQKRGEDEWLWVYSEPDSDVQLASNLTYPSFHEAAKAASIAYPGVPLSPPTLMKRREGPAKKGLPDKVASVLVPIVVLIAWRRSRS